MARFFSLIFFLWLPFAAVPTIDLPHHTPLRFIVTGDAGATHSMLRAGMVAVGRRMRVDGILLVGDNFYPCGVKSLSDPQWTKITQHFGPTHLPIYPVLGNHDYGDQQERGGSDYWTCGHPNASAEIAATGRVRRWHFPARNYLLRSDVAEFVMFDSQPVALAFPRSISGSATAPEEVSWLTKTLDEPEGHWRIVIGHHTIYSSGIHGRTNDATQQRMRALLPLLRKDHVDLYICGHDHDMELIGDLDRRTSDPLFLISGAGSSLEEVRARKAKGEPPTIYPRPPDKRSAGFAVLEVDAHHLSITFYDRSGQQMAGPFTTTKS